MARNHERADKKAFGERVRQQRFKKGWTIEQLAQEVEMDAKAIRAIEAGERFPFRKNLEGLARAFDMTVEDLLDGLPPPGNGEQFTSPSAPASAGAMLVQTNVGTMTGGVLIGVVHGNVVPGASGQGRGGAGAD